MAEAYERSYSSDADRAAYLLNQLVYSQPGGKPSCGDDNTL